MRFDPTGSSLVSYFPNYFTFDPQETVFCNCNLISHDVVRSNGICQIYIVNLNVVKMLLEICMYHNLIEMQGMDRLTS
jgi:hypothetical protein